jgi:hypothetical protein
LLTVDRLDALYRERGLDPWLLGVFFWEIPW